MTTKSAEFAFTAKDQMSATLSKMSGGIISLKTVAVATVAAMVIKFGKDAVNAAMKLETAFAKVQTIGKLTAKQMGEVEKSSVKYGKSAVDLASGLYDIYSAGHKGAEGMKILDAATKASVAGFTSVKNAASSVVDVLNAYGDAVGSATDVTDKLLKGVELGKYVFEDYEGQLGRVTSVADTLHISFDALLSMLVVMTRKGIKFNNAITMMTGVMNACIKPTEDMKEMVRSWGYETAQAAIDALGFVDFLKKVKEHTGDNTEEMGKLIPRVRGLTGAITVLSQNGTELVDVQNQIANSAGTTAEKFKIMANTLEQQMARAGAAWDQFKRDVGEAIIPVIDILVRAYLDKRSVDEAVGNLMDTLDQPWYVKLIMKLPGGTSKYSLAALLEETTKKAKEEAERKGLTDVDIDLDLRLKRIDLISEGIEKGSTKWYAEMLDFINGKIKDLEDKSFKIAIHGEVYGDFEDKTKMFGNKFKEKVISAGEQLAIDLEKSRHLFTLDLDQSGTGLIDDVFTAGDILTKAGIDTGSELVSAAETATSALTKAGEAFGVSMYSILAGVTLPGGGEEGTKLTFKQMQDILEKQLDNMSGIREISEGERETIKESLRRQQDLVDLNNQLYDSALKSIEQDKELGKLSTGQQEALAKQMADAQSTYLTSTEGLLSTLISTVKGLELSPNIFVNVNVRVDQEGNVTTGGGGGRTVGGGGRHDSIPT